MAPSHSRTYRSLSFENSASFSLEQGPISDITSNKRTLWPILIISAAEAPFKMPPIFFPNADSFSALRSDVIGYPLSSIRIDMIGQLGDVTPSVLSVSSLSFGGKIPGTR